MQIIYRRSGGILALVAFAVIAVVATFFAVAVVATTLVVLLAVAAVAFVVRAFSPGRRRGPAAAAEGEKATDVIEGTVVRRIE
jgi:hypothetical protein